MRFASLIIVAALATLAVAGSDAEFTVSGFGTHPISQSICSMWLARPDHRPVLMVYFHGAEGWHNTQWKVASKFEKGKPGWAELQSEKVTLRLSMNVETGEEGVQTGTFKASDGNTFLVLHTADARVPEKIIPLGTYELLPSKDQPASVLLLQSNPEIMERIKRKVAEGGK